jgi:hypothetical protein
VVSLRTDPNAARRPRLPSRQLFGPILFGTEVTSGRGSTLAQPHDPQVATCIDALGRQPLTDARPDVTR